MRHRVVLVLLAAGWALPASGANIRNSIEKLRIQAPAVYYGQVKAVEALGRTKFDVPTRATVTISRVFRGAGAPPREARLTYSSYDEVTLPLAGGPQYRLRPGAVVLAFASSFDGVPAYLLHGRPQEIAGLVESLRRGLAAMHLSGRSLAGMNASQRYLAEVAREGVTDKTRKSQLKLYDEVLAFLGEQAPRS